MVEVTITCVVSLLPLSDVQTPLVPLFGPCEVQVDSLGRSNRVLMYTAATGSYQDPIRAGVHRGSTHEIPGERWGGAEDCIVCKGLHRAVEWFAGAPATVVIRWTFRSDCFGERRFLDSTENLIPLLGPASPPHPHLDPWRGGSGISGVQRYLLHQGIVQYMNSSFWGQSALMRT